MPSFGVYFGTERVGELVSDRSRLRFTYAPQAGDHVRRPLSVRLPLRAEPYEDPDAHPYFANLLPEDEHRRLLAAELRVDTRQVGPLLRAIGGECVGAISIWPSGQAPESIARYEEISPTAFARLVSDAGVTERREITRAGRLSLPGGMDKIALRWDGRGWRRPHPGAPTTHILKWAPPDYPDLSLNEHVTLELLRRSALPVVETELLPEAPKVIIVRRFDRVETETDGSIALLHQEDLCQATGVEPALKYQSDGGPCLADAAKVLRAHARVPAREISRLLDWILASYLVGSTDGHAKNLSFVHYEDGIAVAPIYDVSCSAVYPRFKKLAMSIGGEYRLAYVGLRHWEQLAVELAVRWNAIRDQGLGLAERLEGALAPTIEEYKATIVDAKLLDSIDSKVRTQIHKLRVALSTPKAAP